MSTRLTGYFFAILGVLIISPDSMLIRLIDMNPFSLMFWRGVGIVSVAGVLSIIWYRTKLLAYYKDTGWLGMLISFSFAVSTLCFVYAASTINPIIVLIFVALGPVSGAVFSILLLNEPPRPAVWIAIAISMVGMGIVVYGEALHADAFALLASGQSLPLPPLPGIAALVGVPLILGFTFTLTRKIRQPNIWPSNAVSGMIAMGIALLFMPDLTPPARELWPHFGFLIIMVAGFSFIFISLAPRFISAAETNLVFLLETVLGTVWIWLFLAQRPAWHEIAGGGVVTLAVAVLVMSETAKKRRRAVVRR